MKLVFVYGPPAVGKLTVAQALARLTGFKILHNHLTIDLVQSVLEWGTRQFWRVVERYRLELVEAAAREGLAGLIFTFVYAHPQDGAFVRQVVRRVEKHGGEVLFVQLQAGRNELLRRVRAPSRRQFHKIRKVQTLRDLFKRYDFATRVPSQRHLSVDNTDLSPARVARKVMRHYGLTPRLKRVRPRPAGPGAATPRTSSPSR